MSAETTTITAAKTASTNALKGAEWMVENAYIAPGFHRLLTAGGLTLGLYGGRKFMDVVTARNANSGEETPATQTVELMRPLHGIMRYNPYSDNAADRWKFVIDKMAPVGVGAVGAYAQQGSIFPRRGGDEQRPWRVAQGKTLDRNYRFRCAPVQR